MGSDSDPDLGITIYIGAIWISISDLLSAQVFGLFGLPIRVVKLKFGTRSPSFTQSYVGFRV
jgi:hypothetical protein